MEKKGKEKGEKIGEALMKVALGYQIAEVTEEYAEVDGALRLTKRKKTKKEIPPDLKAVQILLDSSGGAEYGAMTDEELLAEKERLLSALQSAEEEAGKTVKTVKAVKAVKAVKESAVRKTRAKPRKRVVRKKE